VDHPPAVGERHRLAHLLEDRHEPRQVLLGRSALGQQVRQGLSAHQLHGQKGQAVVVVSQFMHRHDAGVRQLRGDLRLDDEPLHQVGTVAQVGTQNLDCKVAVEGGVTGQDHSTHAALCNWFAQFVAPQAACGGGLPLEAESDWFDCWCREYRRHRGASGGRVWRPRGRGNLDLLLPAVRWLRHG